MTAKEQLRERAETFSEEEAGDAPSLDEALRESE
jgi:hypothetical protein